MISDQRRSPETGRVEYHEERERGLPELSVTCEPKLNRGVRRCKVSAVPCITRHYSLTEQTRLLQDIIVIKDDVRLSRDCDGPVS